MNRTLPSGWVVAFWFFLAGSLLIAGCLVALVPGRPSDAGWLLITLRTAALILLRVAWWSVRTPTVRANRALPGLPFVYWLAVWASWSYGTWGSLRADAIFRGGEDLWAFGSDRARTVLGKWPALLIVLRQRVRAQAAASGMVFGYGTLAVLLLAGWFGLWLLIPLSIGVSAKIRRMTRTAP